MVTSIATIITAASTLVSVAATAIASLALVKANKKSKELDNSSKEISLSSDYNAEWVKLYTEIKEENKQRDQEIEKLRQQLQLCSESKIELINKNASLESLKIKYTVTHCDVPNCANRHPQSDY